MVSGSGIRDPRSGIRDPEKTYSGSRIQWSKSTRSRIPDPGSGSATLLPTGNCVCFLLILNPRDFITHQFFFRESVRICSVYFFTCFIIEALSLSFVLLFSSSKPLLRHICRLFFYAIGTRRLKSPNE